MFLSVKLMAIGVVMTALLILQTDTGRDDKNIVINCVAAELKLHPEAHLVDLYKYFFQDVFGPGHLVTDREAALKYLEQELTEAKFFEPADYEELMFRKQFVRVNLHMIVDNEISKEELLHAFMMSARKFKLPEVEQWRITWNEIALAIKETVPYLPDFDLELRQIDSLLQSGSYTVHHSRDYIRLYEPHYRLIKREYFNKLILDKSNRK
jgi:hypothetical protein